MGVRDKDERLRNEVEHPQRYEELTSTSRGRADCAVGVARPIFRGWEWSFCLGTMTHPLLDQEFCDGLAARRDYRRRRPCRGAWQEPSRRATTAPGKPRHQRTRRGRHGPELVCTLPLVVVGSSQGGVLAIIAA